MAEATILDFLAVVVANVITGDRLRGVDSVGGRKFPFPIDKASRC